jgi:nitrile hydratase
VSHEPAYTSLADLGGRLGFGPVQPEPEAASGAPSFHAGWEPQVLALTVAMGATGAWNIDISRAARETLPNYADLSYYQIWLAGVERLLMQRGLASAEELAQGASLQAAVPLPRRLMAADVPAVLARGSPTERPAANPARFAPGQAVRLRADAVAHHTRLPGYARGKQGIVEALHGAHVYPDTHSQGQGEQPCWLYTVVFSERELWGDSAPLQGLSVSIDAWEPYLEPAG